MMGKKTAQPTEESDLPVGGRVTRRIVIAHPERGLFVGQCLGMGFWSRWDAAGQNSVCTFTDEEDARDFIGTWSPTDPEMASFAYHPVMVTRTIDGAPPTASIAALVVAGLTSQLGDLIATMECLTA